MARPSKYDPSITPQLALWMKRCGQTEEQIAQRLQINRDTLYAWKKRYPEFSDALKESGELTDSLVENSLLKRALGYETIERELIEFNGKRRERIVKRQVPPEIAACIFWLKNRQKERWRDKVAEGQDGEAAQITEYKDALEGTAAKVWDGEPGPEA